MPVIKLFGGLRRHVEAPVAEVEGETVRAALDTLCRDNAPLGAAIFEGSGLRAHIRVMIAGRDVDLERGLDTPVALQDEIAIFPPIAGG